jgi:hypothetical protein
MTGSKKGNIETKLRKHPLAPKKPRSAFIFYSQYMHNEGKAEGSDAGGDAAKMVSQTLQVKPALVDFDYSITYTFVSSWTGANGS